VRITLLAAAIALVASVLPVSAQAVMQHYQLNIPRQSLDSALKDFAHQTGLQVARFSDTIDGSAMVGPVSGALSAEEALKSLLAPGGLRFKMVNERTIAIIKAGSPDSKPSYSRALSTSGDEAAQPDQESQGGDAKQAFWSRFRLAQVDQGSSSGSTPIEKRRAQPPEKQALQLEEVLVTAQKREERLRDVPVPVTVISADTLVETNQLRLLDYSTSVPGLNVTSLSRGLQSLSIRGITTSAGSNQTVGVIVDDVPYSSLVGSAALAVPDIDPGELVRVEVLRGPQGTLYGASSLGGLIKFVTIDPSMDRVSGRVQVGINDVYNGANLGYDFRGSINAPLSDTLALRAGAFTREDPGYIDNPVRHVDGIGKGDVYGGHVAGLWQPSGAFSLKLSALYQDTKENGTAQFEAGAAGLGDLQQNDLPMTGTSEVKAQAYSAIWRAKLGHVDLTSVSGYNVTQWTNSLDYTSVYGGLAQAFFHVGGAPLTYDVKAKNFSQEIRLSATAGQRIDWLFGLFYTHQDTAYLDRILAADSATGGVVGQVAYASDVTLIEEEAVFTDVTFHLTDRFNVQVGGRGSRYRQTDGPSLVQFGAPPPTVSSEIDDKANAVTYLVTPQLKVSPDLMLYARLASGYRPGSPNGPLSPIAKADPDKTQNYELGLKGDFFTRALSMDASLYYIDWKDIQMFLSDPKTGFTYQGNGSRAKSQGLEFSVEARPTRGLTIAAWVASDDAVLTKAFPPTTSAYGVPGNRLPYSSRFSGNFSVDQEFRLGIGITGRLGAVMSYVGDRLGEFTGSAAAPRQDLPAYTRIDLRGGARFGYWTLSAFVNNLADKRGISTASLVPPTYVVIQPRTVGMSVARSF
jgi:iron complex outermembrane receptor protein